MSHKYPQKAAYISIASLLAIVIFLAIARFKLFSYFNIPPQPFTSLEWFSSLYYPFWLTYDLILVYPFSVVKAWVWALSFLIVYAVAIAALYHKRFYKPEPIGHGSSSWALTSDLKEAGLIDGTSSSTPLIVGHYGNQYLTHHGSEPVITYGPTGCGKTASTVIPNLVSNESSVYVNDTKNELWEKTAGYRKNVLKQKTIRHDVNCTDGSAARFNVFTEVDINSLEAVKSVQFLMDYIIPVNSKNKDDNTSHFINSARSFGAGLALHQISLAENKGDPMPCAYSLLKAVSTRDKAISDYLDEMVEYTDATASVVDTIQGAAIDMKNLADREFSGVLSSLRVPLQKYRDPILTANTSVSDFRMTDLVDEPTSLYFGVTPKERDRLGFYYEMFLNLLYRRLLGETMEENPNRHKLLLMLDEFTSIPPAPVVQESMDVIRAYGMQVFITVPDIISLKQHYQDETFTTHAKVHIASTPSNQDSAKTLSDMCGTKTVVDHSVSRQQNINKYVAPTVSESIHSRPLITSEEIRRMRVPTIVNDRMVEGGEQLLFVRGMKPLRCDQKPYFFDDELLRRTQIPPPNESDRTIKNEQAN